MKKQLSVVSCQLSDKAKRLRCFFTSGYQLATSNCSRGFTLIEMLVSITLFAIVMVVCVGALLSLVGANKKAQALESVMNNLNISLDDMVRSIREGSNYNCGGMGVPNLTTGHNADCTTNPSNIFSFTPYGAVTSNANGRTVYECVACSGTTGGYMERSEDGGAHFSPLTAPEVSITHMNFYVIGTQQGDTTQPRVIITIDGTAGGGNVKTTTSFHLQATAVQRALDL